MEQSEPKKIFERQHVLPYFLRKLISSHVVVKCLSLKIICVNIYLTISRKKQVMHLPDKYSLRKWTKNAKIGSAYEPMIGLSVDDG